MTYDYVIFMDGGCTANPGELAVAAVVCTADGEHLLECAKAAGQGTNNVAEYRALAHAVAMASLAGARRPLFLSDSMLVVNQVNATWASSVGELGVQLARCQAALRRFDGWSLEHVPRARNRRADWLVCRQLGHARTLKKAPPVGVQFRTGAPPRSWAATSSSSRRPAVA